MGIQGKSIKETLHNFKINIRYQQNYFKINMLNTYLYIGVPIFQIGLLICQTFWPVFVDWYKYNYLIYLEIKLKAFEPIKYKKNYNFLNIAYGLL